ncbi:MAG: hypothetical protein ACJ8H8_24675 [Geminicoccaceae bacterium]
MSVTERVLAVAIVAITMLVLVVTTLRSYRRGGTGPMPRVLPVTRRGRARMNATWEKHGWAKPFDEDGNLLPARERQPPPDN